MRTPEEFILLSTKLPADWIFVRIRRHWPHTLNYPNPVDGLRGKTGHGIWIHSKGFELVPTKGCVAIG